MTKTERKRILQLAQEWFRTVIVPNHLKNTKKLASVDKLDINPFHAPDLAAYLTGEISPDSIAKVIVYSRALGTSISTSFGTNIQKFISDVLKGSFGSMVSGIDIEFKDALDGRHKWCQIKLGPNTINKDDVETIHRHFKSARNLANTNNIKVAHGDIVVGILYGKQGQESNHYKRLRDEFGYPLFIGEEFWHRLTGDKKFYTELRQAIADVAIEARGQDVLEMTIRQLAKVPEIKKIAS